MKSDADCPPTGDQSSALSASHSNFIKQATDGEQYTQHYRHYLLHNCVRRMRSSSLWEAEAVGDRLMVAFHSERHTKFHT